MGAACRAAPAPPPPSGGGSPEPAPLRFSPIIFFRFFLGLQLV